MDDWNASAPAPADVKDEANDHPRTMTPVLTRARPFMDDFHPSRKANAQPVLAIVRSLVV
jgi:hypothetical protein